MTTDIYARLRDLAASAEAKPDEMRPVLLRVTTDLFALHPRRTPEEIRLYEEMASKLIDDADETTLASVARKLSGCPDAPPAVLSRIRARGGEPAREILLRNSQIGWRELRQIAAAGPCDQTGAVAGRADLDRDIVRLLAARPEREIARALAANARAPLSSEDARLLAARGRDDAILARALLDRRELTLDHLPLYLFANPRERSKLLALTIEAQLAQAGRLASGATLDEEKVARIEDVGARQKRASFALAMADLLHCDSLVARRLVEDESGDALALAFIAIGLPPESAARIFLVAFPKVALSPEIFDRNMRLFESVPRRAAVRLVEAMVGSPREAPAFRSSTIRPHAAAAASAARDDARPAERVENRDQNRA